MPQAIGRDRRSATGPATRGRRPLQVRGLAPRRTRAGRSRCQPLQGQAARRRACCEAVQALRRRAGPVPSGRPSRARQGRRSVTQRAVQRQPFERQATEGLPAPRPPAWHWSRRRDRSDRSPARHDGSSETAPVEPSPRCSSGWPRSRATPRAVMPSAASSDSDRIVEPRQRCAGRRRSPPRGRSATRSSSTPPASCSRNVSPKSSLRVRSDSRRRHSSDGRPPPSSARQNPSISNDSRRSAGRRRHTARPHANRGLSSFSDRRAGRPARVEPAGFGLGQVEVVHRQPLQVHQPRFDAVGAGGGVQGGQGRDGGRVAQAGGHAQAVERGLAGVEQVVVLLARTERGRRESVDMGTSTNGIGGRCILPGSPGLLGPSEARRSPRPAHARTPPAHSTRAVRKVGHQSSITALTSRPASVRLHQVVGQEGEPGAVEGGVEQPSAGARRGCLAFHPHPGVHASPSAVPRHRATRGWAGAA